MFEIATRSITTRVETPYAFYFREVHTNKVIAVARNLTDLLIHVEKINIESLKYHLFRTADLNLNGEINGSYPRGDLALWVQYILGDDKLASQIWDLKDEINTPSVREKLVHLIRLRHNELIDILKKKSE